MGSLGISGAVNKGVSLLQVRTKTGDLEEIRMMTTRKKYYENLPSSKDPNNWYEKNKTANVVKNYINSWDWHNISKKNLSDKGLFLEFTKDILEEANNKKWHETWRWFAVREYYQMICKNKLGQRFKCDVIPHGQAERNAISNIKKILMKFNFTEYMEVIYYLLHDPEDVYAYGFFASEFKLIKMTKHDRVLKVQSIMNNRNYWDEAKLFLESENDILQSNEYKQELEMQAIAHLSESDKQILYKLEIEVKILNDEIQRLDLFQEELCNRKIEINDFIISYNSNLGKFGENIAEQFTVEIYQGQGIFMPSVKEALKELDEIIKDTTFEKLAKLEIKVKQMTDEIARLRTLQ